VAVGAGDRGRASSRLALVLSEQKLSRGDYQTVEESMPARPGCQYGAEYRGANAQLSAHVHAKCSLNSSVERAREIFD